MKGSFEWMWFGWAFFLFSWNLMARSCSVGNIMLQHMRWADDCLIVRLPKHKGDQEGEALLMDRHVYANPLEPCICPILALAVLTFSQEGVAPHEKFTPSSKEKYKKKNQNGESQAGQAELDLRKKEV